MRKSLFICLAALIVLAVSCKKDNSNDVSKQKFGVDGVTPLPEAVDLGTVVNGKTVLWASFNLGASKPEEYGDYYAWGEKITYYSTLEPLVWAKRNETDENVLHYDWDSYLYANGAYYKLTKYCPKGLETNYWDNTAKPEGPDGEVQLLPSDDVAHVKLGGKWRMPTLDDIKALLALKTNDDYTWDKWALATDENGDEVKDAWGNVVRGIRITRKSTGATLFLPAAGLCSGTDVGENAGSWGYYWSSSLNTVDPYAAFNLSFRSGGSDWSDLSRFDGFAVRPVYED